MDVPQLQLGCGNKLGLKKLINPALLSNIPLKIFVQMQRYKKFDKTGDKET